MHECNLDYKGPTTKDRPTMKKKHVFQMIVFFCIFLVQARQANHKIPIFYGASLSHLFFVSMALAGIS